MMANLNDDLAHVRELQGKPPLPSPHVIQGFEPGSAPVPPYNPIALPSRQSEEDPIDDEFLDGGPPPEEPTPPSPLIPRHRIVPPPGKPTLDETLAASLQAAMSGPAPLLAVLDREATWKGRAVRLSESDERQVRAVVLKAIQREVAADLQAAGVRRVRKAVPEPKAPTGQPVRRGRQRKEQP